MKRKLFLITDFFPYGTGETFVMTELQQLCLQYDVTVVPRYVGEGEPRPLPEGVKKLDVARSSRFAEKVRFVLSFFFGKKGREEIAAVWRSGENRLARWKKSLLSFASAELFWTEFKENGCASQPEGTIYYSFWYTPAAVALALHRDELPGAKIVARTNGYDLYNDRATGGRQPFKPAADRGMDMVISSCRYGMDYYKTAFGEVPGTKYIYSALGSDDAGFIGQDGEGRLHLVSCSNAFPIKRIRRIIDGIALLENVPVCWTHIGGGWELEALRAYAENKLNGRDTVQCRFVGVLSHEEVLNFYKQQPVDCFITTSASEGGCPVSIQEAMSFGVPVIGTAVGGVTEMLSESENILLPEDPAAEDVAAALERMYRMTAEEKEALRRFNRRRWEERYNAEENGRRLAEQMERLWEDD